MSYFKTVKCTRKGCKFFCRVERAVEFGLELVKKTRRSSFGDILAYTALVINKCPKCSTPNTLEVSRIEGFASEHVCDARCTGATGKQCECSCGGANHGMAV